MKQSDQISRPKVLKESSKVHLFTDADLGELFRLFVLVAVYVNMLFPQCILSPD